MYIKRIGGWGYFPDAVVYMAVLPSTAKCLLQIYKGCLMIWYKK